MARIYEVVLSIKSAGWQRWELRDSFLQCMLILTLSRILARQAKVYILRAHGWWGGSAGSDSALDILPCPQCCSSDILCEEGRAGWGVLTWQLGLRFRGCRNLSKFMGLQTGDLGLESGPPDPPTIIVSGKLFLALYFTCLYSEMPTDFLLIDWALLLTVWFMPAAATAPGSLLEMQTLGLHPDLLNQNLHFNKSPGNLNAHQCFRNTD